MRLPALSGPRQPPIGILLPVALDVRAIERSISFARRRLHILQDADDFAQDAWVHLLSKKPQILSKFRGDSRIETYLSRVILNFGMNWCRVRYRRRTLTECHIDDVVAEYLWSDCTDPSVRYEQRMLRLQAKHALRAALARLTAADRQLLWDWANGRIGVHRSSLRRATANAVYCRVSRVFRKARRLAMTGATARIPAARVTQDGA